jgi:hypothetical protein
MGTSFARLRPASAKQPNSWLASPQLRQAPSALACDKSLQARSNYRGLFTNASQPSCFLKQSVVDVERSSHLHSYVLLAHLTAEGQASFQQALRPNFKLHPMRARRTEANSRA